MKIIQVAAGLDEPAAGPSYSVRRLASGLQALGAEVELHSVLGWRGPPVEGASPTPQRHRQDAARAPLLRAACLSSALHQALGRSASDAQVIHTHGLWLMPNVYPAWVSRASGLPLVISPRGMLGGAALKFSRLRKAVFWRLLQGPAARAAACLHATSDSEYEEIRAFGLTNPVAVIPNGVEIPDPTPRPRAPGRTVLSLGRVHPKKGLANLVQAWAQVEDRFPDWRLRIVGPDEGGHAGELARLAQALGLKGVTIEPPAFGEAKASLYAEADLFVLPSLNENFALTVAESLAAATPVIVTRGAPWGDIETRRCGWWINIGADPMAEALARAMATPRDDLEAMGRRGRAWMEKAFSWSHVSERMLGVYDWLADGGERPSEVRLD